MCVDFISIVTLIQIQILSSRINLKKSYEYTYDLALLILRGFNRQ